MLTLFHFADNTINIDAYPAASWQPDWFWVVVLLSWPLFTAFGIAGYRLYERGDFRRAHPCLVFYSYTGLVSLGHFVYGPPSALTTRALVSVVVDAVVGGAVLLITIRSIRARRRAAVASG